MKQTTHSIPSNKRETSPYRCGIFLPSSNTTVEKEAFLLMKALRDQVQFHFSRLYLSSVTERALLAMKTHLKTEITKLASANMDCYLYACTSGSFIKGMPYAKGISDEIKKQTGKPAITTAEAVIKAIKSATDAKYPRIILITPYVETITLTEKKFLEEQGIQVIHHSCMGITDNLEIGEIPLTKLVHFIQSSTKEAKDPLEADLLFISCTNLQTMPIGFLEKNLGLPVVSSNSASFYAVIKALKKQGLDKARLIEQKTLHLFGTHLL